MFLVACVILFMGVSVQGILCPGVSVQESLGLCPGGSLSGRPPYGKEWEVRILLECILVQLLYLDQIHKMMRQHPLVFPLKIKSWSVREL